MPQVNIICANETICIKLKGKRSLLYCESLIVSLRMSFVLYLQQVSSSHVTEPILDYTGTLSVTTTDGSGSTTLTGTVFGKDSAVLVKYNELQFSSGVTLSGHLLLAAGKLNPTQAVAKILSKLGTNGVEKCSFSCASGSSESVVVLSTESAQEESACSIDGARFCVQVLL